MKNKNAKLRRLKYGSVATVLTILLIAVVVVLNIICTTLTKNYSLKLDISGDSLYKLNNQTLQIINKMDKEVNFYVVSAEDDYITQFKEILRRLVNAGDNFTLEYVDPDKNPTFATSFGSQYNISTGALVMKCGQRVRVVQQSEMYQSDSTSGAVTYLLEERVAAGLLSFMQDSDQTVYFVTGHGESKDQTFRNLFANNGYTVEDIKLYSGMKFSENAKMMIIAAPAKDYSVAEVSVIENFLNNGYMYGRHLMVFTDATSIQLPNLESFLSERGMVFDRNMVLEGDKNYYINLPTVISPQMADNETTEKIQTAQTPMVLAAARSITSRFEENGNLTVIPILTTSSSAYGKSTEQGSNITSYEKVSGDTNGPLTLATLSKLTKVYNNQDVYSYVFAVGSTQMLTSDYMSYASNGDFLITMYNFMLGQENDTVLDSVKYTASQTMTMTDAQKTTATAVVLGVIPGIVLLIGIAVFIRRKNL